MNIEILEFYIRQAKEKFNSSYNREIESINIRKITIDKIYFLIDCKDIESCKKYKVVIPIKKITLAEKI